MIVYSGQTRFIAFQSCPLFVSFVEEKITKMSSKLKNDEDLILSAIEQQRVIKMRFTDLARGCKGLEHHRHNICIEHICSGPDNCQGVEAFQQREQPEQETWNSAKMSPFLGIEKFQFALPVPKGKKLDLLILEAISSHTFFVSSANFILQDCHLIYLFPKKKNH